METPSREGWLAPICAMTPAMRYCSCVVGGIPPDRWKGGNAAYCSKKLGNRDIIIVKGKEWNIFLQFTFYFRVLFRPQQNTVGAQQQVQSERHSIYYRWEVCQFTTQNTLQYRHYVICDHVEDWQGSTRQFGPEEMEKAEKKHEPNLVVCKL